MNSGSGATVIYDICGRRWSMGAPGFADAIADAFEQRQRPRCLCQRGEDGQGIEMYVARLMDGYLVKRMPNSGSQHASSCPSYQPPAESSGLGQVLGNAIVEDPATGETMLRLPDQAFAIGERLFRRMERRFATELTLWGADDAMRLVIIATFCVTHAGLPCIENLSLMALTPEWLPISNCYEAHLVRTLVHGRRSFVKMLHYNMQIGTNMASALLIDTHEVVEMFIEADAEGRWNKGSDRVPASSVAGGVWTWRPSQESLPGIPDNVSRMPTGCENQTLV